MVNGLKGNDDYFFLYAVLFGDLFVILNCWTHLFFVIKYWILAKKIQQLLSVKGALNDKTIELRARVLTGSMMALILISFAMDISFYKEGVYADLHFKSQQNWYWRVASILLKLFYLITPYFIVIVQVLAFRTIN